MQLKMYILAIYFLLSFLSGLSDGHLCIINPKQRGTMNIQQSGDPSCFRHGAPCGGEPPQKYWSGNYEGGSSAFIKWQQNYNHYEVGYPGYMDIAIAQENSSDFQVLAIIQDEYVYAQDHQQNYSVSVVIPKMSCDRCVLRARYNSHKPGEEIFYQCSDIRIYVLSDKERYLKQQHRRKLLPAKNPDFKEMQKAIDFFNKKLSSRESANGPSLYGFTYNMFDQRMHYVKIDVETGEMSLIYNYDFSLGSGTRLLNTKYRNVADAPLEYVADGIVAVDKSRGRTALLFHSGVDLDQSPNFLLEVNTLNGSVMSKVPLRNVDGTPINALVYYQPGAYLTFSIHTEGEAGTYFFTVGELRADGTYTRLMSTKEPETLYVNYQWAEYDRQRSLLYVLMGNENSPDKLDARMFVFALNNRTLLSANLLDTKYNTFQSMHLYEQDGGLYAVSPGTSGQKYPIFGLIRIDPLTGSVNNAGPVTDYNDEVFGTYYGGSVVSGIDQSTGMLYHVLRVADAEADSVASIPIGSMNGVSFSPMTYLRHVHNLNMVVN